MKVQSLAGARALHPTLLPMDCDNSDHGHEARCQTAPLALARFTAVLVEETKEQGWGKTMVMAALPEAIKKGSAFYDVTPKLAGRSKAC
jgi:hypothetical protein